MVRRAVPNTVRAGSGIDGARRRLSKSLALALGGAALPALAQPIGRPVRIGYAIARTGPWATGAQESQEPNYLLWVEQCNAAGGLDVAGERRPIQLIGLDDQSDIDTCVQHYEKLMGSDKVDLLLPPWGTSANFAVAPIANRFGYPLLAPTALSRKLVDMGLPNFFSLLQQADRMMGALVDLLVAAGAKTVAVLYIDDLFGYENLSALQVRLAKTSLKLLDQRAYTADTKDLRPILRGFKSLKPDAFVAITYPPATFLASQQSADEGFNPAFFYASVGTAFKLYRTTLQRNAEGVIGMGTWNSRSSPDAKRYFDAYVQRFGKEPDRWASGHGWAGLQIMQQAAARTGVDRHAMRDYIAKTEFATIVGPIRFAGSENVATPGSAGQWQGSEFEIVWPRARATAALIAPKPPWR